MNIQNFRKLGNIILSSIYLSVYLVLYTMLLQRVLVKNMWIISEKYSKTFKYVRNLYTVFLY